MAVVDERRLWLQVRQAFLMVVDAIEVHQKIEPRTSQLRRDEKNRIKKEKRNQNANG